MEKLSGFRKGGTFSIPNERKIYGELSLNGAETSLYLRDGEFFNAFDIHNDTILGVMHDLTKVSLIHCNIKDGPGTASRGSESYNFATVFPHFVVFGDSHIEPSDPVVYQIHFVVDDWSNIFYDFDAFGSMIDASPHIEGILAAQSSLIDRNIPVGLYPEILYFTGKQEIFSANTSIGKISASHRYKSDIGGPKGVHLTNTIYVNIAPQNPITFFEGIDRVITLLNFLGVVGGRPQGIRKLSLSLGDKHKLTSPLEVYWSMPPKREGRTGQRDLHPADLPIDAVREPENFAHVLMNWVARNDAWKDARMRFSNSTLKQNLFDIDRLVGSANMFDILPKSSMPDTVEMPDELRDAQSRCREIFERLPDSPERNSILSALGRLGTNNLKQKVRFRALPLLDAIGEDFPELTLVINQAVDCRNHYVHGGPFKFDYNKNFWAVHFFTKTLEFVFAASDLLESGWDIKAWRNKGTTLSHPLHEYRYNYASNLQALKSLMSAR